MGEPMTKDRLRKYIFIRREVENHMERLERMKNQAMIPARRDGDGSQHTPGASDRMADAIIKRLIYEDEISDRVKANLEEMEKVRGAIEGLEDPMEREVLRLRYMDGTGYRLTPWRDVAVSLYGDDDEAQIRAVFRIHGRALQHIRAIEV